MSGRNTPVSGAGPRRSSRFRPPIIRRRASSLSAATDSSSLGACLLGEWKGPSNLDLNGSPVTSQDNFSSFGRAMGLFNQRGSDSKHSSAGLSSLGRPVTAGSRSPALFSSQDPPLSKRNKPLPPPPISLDSEEEPDGPTRRAVHGPPFSMPSRPFPTSPLPRQRTRSAVASTAHPLSLEDELPRILSAIYDPESRRVTIVEGLADDDEPFVLDVPPRQVGDEEPSPDSPFRLPYKEIAQQFTRKFESLLSTAKARLPKTFKLVITTPRKEPRPDGTHTIGVPYGFVHTVEVKIEPKSGTLVGVPPDWLIPPLSQDGHGSKKAHPLHIPKSPTSFEPPEQSIWGHLRHELSTTIGARLPRPRLLSFRRPSEARSRLPGESPRDTSDQLHERKGSVGQHSKSSKEKGPLSLDGHDAREHGPPVLELPNLASPPLDQMEFFSPYSGTVYSGLLWRWQPPTPSPNVNTSPEPPAHTPAATRNGKPTRTLRRIPNRI